MEKHSSLSAAVWSLLSVQTWTLEKVKSCSHSSKEFCFPHTVLRKVLVEMREVHEITPAFSSEEKKKKSLFLFSLWCGKLECPGPGGSHYLSLVFLPQGKWPGLDKFPHTWAFLITWEMQLLWGSWIWLCWKILSLWMVQAVLEMNPKHGRTFVVFQRLTMQQNECYLRV